ncbi:MAG: hypothetical protein Q9207_000286 [Kuettlingeria erythrocarpa]
MNQTDFASFPPPPGLPPLQSLVRPDQIPRLTGISEEKKSTYINGVGLLYDQIKSRPPESPEYYTAYKKLSDVSEQLKRHMNQMKAAQIGSRPASQGQTAGDVRTTSQQTAQPPLGQPREQQFSQKVLDHVRKENFATPSDILAQGPQRIQMWQRQMKHNYAVHLQKFDTANMKLLELNVLQQTKEGKTISQQDAQQLNNFKNQYTQMAQEARDYIAKFKAQQDGIKAMQNQSGNATTSALDTTRVQTPVTSAAEHPNSVLEPQASRTIPAANTVSDHQGHPHTVSSALDAARNHANASGRPDPITGNSGGQASQGQASQGPANQAASTQTLDGQAAPENSQSHQNMNTSSSTAPSQYHSPQAQNPTTNSTAHGPHPLSHQAAITQSAHKYSQHTYQNPVAQPTSHAHPPMSGRDPQNNNPKMPIPRDLKVPQPQPVVMGPARPTLTGGPSNGAMGPMGQPAIQKHPGYVLEGDGERVLGRKKLEELVRQVTGGVDGEEGETLTAAAEETLLDVADDFVDQVVTAACKLAKLRSSQTLELRDIQLVLERNYNIRIPGYASDELRTVKKVQPTPGWTQKLAAVQAAKVTGGKGDI